MKLSDNSRLMPWLVAALVVLAIGFIAPLVMVLLKFPGW